MTQELNKYITTRYPRWLDYARFHATLAGINDLSRDLLHTVLLNVCEKPQDKIIDLYHRKKECYAELDYYILKMIKLNCHSSTSPFRYYFFEHLPVDANVDPWQSWRCLNIYDNDDPETDDQFANGYLSDLRLLRLAIEKADLSQDERTMTKWTMLSSEQVKYNPYLSVSQSAKYKVFNSGRQKVKETFKKLKYSE